MPRPDPRSRRAPSSRRRSTRRRVPRRRAPRGRSAGKARAGATSALRRFTQATFLTLAITAFLLLLLGVEPGAAQDPTPAPQETVAPADTIPPDLRADALAREATTQARDTFVGMWQAFVAGLPQLAVVLLILMLAWGLVRLTRPLVRRATGRFATSNAVTALWGIAVWVIAIGAAVSVIAGDIRALLGSLGLVGLALSWALQTPIESFSGWLLNSFQGYYRVGDRIAVGDVFGDVAEIDFLTTTVWEYGGADRAPSGITAEQPTGRIITFPNNEVLQGSIVNYTRDFPYVWDELVVSIAEESDLRYAAEVVRRVADDLLAERMTEPAESYARTLERTGLPHDISARPEVFFAVGESGVDLVVRYLVGARERRRWKSELTALVLTELNREEHAGRVVPHYPRRQVQFVGADGVPTGGGEVRR